MYRCCAPPPDLAPYVRLLWAVDAPADAVRATETIVPDGCCELIVHCGAPYRLCDGASIEAQPDALIHGQLERAMLLAPGGAVELVAARFEPAGLATLFGIDPRVLRSSAVALRDVFGAAARDLADAVRDARTTGERWALLIDYLRRFTVGRVRRNSWLAHHAAAKMSTGIGAPELARQLGASWRTVERSFVSAVGLTPRQFMRLQRISRAANALAYGGAELADVALSTGFADQAHFTREFRDLIGTTPGRFLREARASAPSIVPA